MEGTMKICIIGCGMISAYHAEAIKAVEGMELCGFYDAYTPAAEKKAAETNTVCFRTLEEIWESDVDAVTICTPSGTHGGLTIAALNAGKHAIVEKPLALTAEELDQILEAEKKTGKICAPISQHRCSEGVMEAKELLEKGTIGKPIGVNTTIRYHRDREYYSSSSWKGTIRMDGGVLMNQGIHAIDIMCFLNGYPDRVQGFCNTLFHNIEAEDTAAAVLYFPDGKLGTLIGTTAAASGSPWRMEIWGTEGSITLEEDVLTLVNDLPRKADTDTKVGGFDKPDGIPVTEHVKQLQNISDAVRGISKLDYSSQEAAETVRLILQITANRNIKV